MQVVVTGGAGFLGQRLAHQLLKDPEVESLVLADIVVPPGPEDARVKLVQADLSKSEAANSLISDRTTVVYHLAAVVSGQAEADFDLGMSVNCDGTRNLLEAVRRQSPDAKFVFASSLAVFGGELPAVILEETAVMPQSSYGTQKAVSELWVNDYSRKGFVDGRVLRLPTVCVRPGKPNAAASSFASSIIREPVKGETAVCPVDVSLRLWLASPNAVVDNLVRAKAVEADRFGLTRTVNLPGITVSVKEMIESLERVVGAEAAKHIRYESDEAIARIVESWPSEFETSRAIELGFVGDRSFDDVVRAFVAEQTGSTLGKSI